MQEIFLQLIYLFTFHKDFAFLFSMGIIILLGLIKLIFLLLDPRIKRIKITPWTYIGAICYPLFYILFLLIIRIVHITIPIDLKKFAIIIESIDLNLLNVINGLLVGIIFLHLIFLVFSTILRILQYQIWKLYIYYRHKNYYNKEQDLYESIPQIIKFECHWSYQNFCLLVTLKMQKFSQKYGIKSLEHFCRYKKNWYPVFRYLVFGLIPVFLFLECYFNNGIIEYTKFYLLFSAIFVLWYRFSMFFQYKEHYIDQMLYEREYCFPEIVYVNLTEEEENMLEIYKDKPYLVMTNDLLKWDKITPDIHFYKRFKYVSAENLALIEEDGKMKDIKEEYIYANWNSLKGFAKEHLIIKEGNRCYVDDYL